MKKIKLITSLCSIGALVTTTPVVASSCSCSNEEALKIQLATDNISVGEDKEIWASIIDNKGEPVHINRIESAISDDESILSIQGVSVFENTIGVIRVDAFEQGTVKLSLSMSDKDDKEVNGEFDITIGVPEGGIEVAEEGENCSYENGVLTIDDSSLSSEVELFIGGLVGASFNLKDEVTGISIDGSLLKIDADTIFEENPNTITIQSEGFDDLTIDIIAIAEIKALLIPINDPTFTDLYIPDNLTFGAMAGDQYYFSLKNVSSAVTFTYTPDGTITGTYSFDSSTNTLSVTTIPSGTDTITITASYNNSETMIYTLKFTGVPITYFVKADFTTVNCNITSGIETDVLSQKPINISLESSITISDKENAGESWYNAFIMVNYTDFYPVESEYQTSGDLQYLKFSDRTLTMASNIPSKVGVYLTYRSYTVCYFIYLLCNNV